MEGDGKLAMITRLAHHIWGFMISIVSLVSPTLSAIMFIGFIIYELDEEWHIKDKSYKDIKEMLIGMGIGAVIAIIATLIHGTAPTIHR